MNKTRLRAIEKALGDLKPKNEPTPFKDWTLEELRDHYDRLMNDLEKPSPLDSLSLDELMALWQKQFVEGKN